MKIIGINGIRSDGAAQTDLMLNDLKALGYETADCNYPRVEPWEARSRGLQVRNARILLDLHEKGDVLIAHSYGGLLALRSMELGAQWSKVFLFGAAMNEDFTFPYLGMKELFNIHNPTDLALGAGSMLVAHDFGNMGRTGYAGAPDPRIVNIQATHEEEEPLRHSSYFMDVNRPRWVELVCNVLNT